MGLAQELTPEQHQMTRIPWGPDGLPVIAQSFWAPNLQKMGEQFNLTSGQCLHWHPDYEKAKKNGDADAALQAILTVTSDQRLMDLQQKIAGRDVIFLAPFVPKADGGRNMLPITFAHFLAKRFGAQVADNVRQVARVGRKEMDGLDRLLHQPSFAGTIQPGRNYVLVDDNTTLGGTAATLRSFVEKNGGKVTCLASLTIAHHIPDSANTHQLGAHDLLRVLKSNIAATPAQIKILEKRVGPHVGNILERYCHFGAGTLTRGEADTAGGYGHSLKQALHGRSATGTNPAGPQRSAPGGERTLH